MGETIADMDVEIEERDNKISFLENKIGIADDKVVEELNNLDLKKTSYKEKCDRKMNRLNKTLNSHKYIKNLKKIKTTTFKKWFCFDKILFLETIS